MRSTPLFLVLGLVSSASLTVSAAVPSTTTVIVAPTPTDVNTLAKSKHHHHVKLAEPAEAHSAAVQKKLPGRKIKHGKGKAESRNAKRDQRLAKKTADAVVERSGVADVVAKITGAGNSVGGTDSLANILANLRIAQGTLNSCQNTIHRYRSNLKSSPSLIYDKAYQRRVSSELLAWRKAAGTSLPYLNQVHNSLQPLGPEKGLAAYDPNNQLETLIKQVVDSLKYTLADVNYMVYKIPVLGPILGPIVYDVKCIVDDVLNLSEVQLDQILNGLGPQLSGLNVQLAATVCKAAPSLGQC